MTHRENINRIRTQYEETSHSIGRLRYLLKKRGDLYSNLRNFVYVAGPFRPSDSRSVAQHIGNARDLACRIWERGHYVFCPHLNSGFMFGLMDEACFLEGDLFILSLCDVIMCTGGWEHSAGTLAELDLAEELGILKLPELGYLPEIPWPSMESYSANRSKALLNWREHT